MRESAASCGLSLVGIIPANAFEEDRDHLKRWQEGGLSGQMTFMNRDADLLSDPRRLFEGAKTLLVCAIRYDALIPPSRLEGFGRVARYAWGRDYHRVLKKLLKRFHRALEELAGRSISGRQFSDAVPLLERAAARRAGIGFVGKNTMLIRPKVGSLFFLSELILDIEIECAPVKLHTLDCGSCNRCQQACPTGALVRDRVLDARRCISYLTIEKEGHFEEWERLALGEWVFGCDVCQEVCPFNHVVFRKGVRADLEELKAEAGVGPLLSLASVLRIRCDAEFTERFKGTPLMRPGREGLLRNAAVVSANTRSTNVRDALESALEDDSPIVRQHAAWALERL